jgi:hypothetical protein
MHFNLLYLVVFVVLLNLVRYLTHFPMFIKSLCFHFQVLFGGGPVTGIIIPERVVLEHTQKLWGSASLYSPGARLRSSPALAAPCAPSPARRPPALRSTPLLNRLESAPPSSGGGGRPGHAQQCPTKGPFPPIFLSSSLASMIDLVAN